MQKTILVTGAYGGMGRATTLTLAKMGYRVLALDKKVGEVEENIIPIEADLTCEQSVRNAYEKVTAQIDSLHAIIHFAGIYMLDSLVEMETEAFEKIFKVNLEGVFLVNKQFMPLLSHGSRIIITTSELATLDPLPFTGIYAITKGALDKYAFSLRMELQLKGIDVSVLRAGAVDTGMLDASMHALEAFHKKTKIYTCNAERFKNIVNKVEARHISPDKLAKKAIKILRKKHPKFAYSINRNPLLLLLGALPRRLQLWIIKQILKTKKGKENEGN